MSITHLSCGFLIPVHFSGEVHKATYNNEESDTSYQQRKVLLQYDDEDKCIKRYQEQGEEYDKFVISQKRNGVQADQNNGCHGGDTVGQVIPEVLREVRILF